MLSRCPHCRLPISRNEALLPTCPLCGGVFRSPQEPFPPSPLPPEAQPDETVPPAEPRRFPWFALLPVVVALAAGGICLYRLAPKEAEPPIGPDDSSLLARLDEPATQPESLPQPPLEKFSTRPAVTEPATRPEPPTLVGDAKDKDAPPDATTSKWSELAAEPGKPLSPPAPADTPLPPAAPPSPPENAPATAPRDSEDIAFGPMRSVKIDRPDGMYDLEYIDDGQSVTVSGKVGTLVVPALNGQASLDATALEAREIILGGGINGSASVRLRAPGGTVVFKDSVNGEAIILVDAPDGKVVFGADGPASPTVNGTCRIEITARDVDLRGQINGGTQVTVTLTPGGSLKFHEIGGGVRLHYRLPDGEAEPRIEPGVVGSGTEFRKVAPSPPTIPSTPATSSNPAPPTAPSASIAEKQTFRVDFGTWTDPPLVKTKFGVYQTPLISQDALIQSLALLGEAGVRDFRYEIGWGKPDVLAHDQIAGSAENPTLNFASIDRLIEGLHRQGVRPLLALTYCPNPLKTRRDWHAWKDVPSHMGSWQSIVRRYAAHLRDDLKLAGPFYEVWNEPDLDVGGKVFSFATPEEYGRIYAHAAEGVREGDADALVGGAAVAWFHGYTDAMFASGKPIDFVTIHAYANYPQQIAGMRDKVRNRPELPILLTEYAAYKDFPEQGPVSRHGGAVTFFRDLKGLLEYTDVTKVYWAQWVDDRLGMLTGTLHRKALYNALKAYQTMLPVDRCKVDLDGAGGVHLLAGADENNAAVALWNLEKDDRTVTVEMRNFPFAAGVGEIYRIDKDNASFVDNAAAEQMVAADRGRVNGRQSSWTGNIPGESVVFLKFSDGTGRSLLTRRQLGTVVRNHGWYADRDGRIYADFDEHTWIARLGMGDRDLGVAIIGTVIDRPQPRLSVQVRKAGPFQARDTDSAFALRVDFRTAEGTYGKSVVFHGELYDSRRVWALPWGKGSAVADETLAQKEMDGGLPFTLDLAKLAPPNWDRQRVILTFLLQNAGAGSRARIVLSKG